MHGILDMCLAKACYQLELGATASGQPRPLLVSGQFLRIPSLILLLWSGLVGAGAKTWGVPKLSPLPTCVCCVHPDLIMADTSQHL